MALFPHALTSSFDHGERVRLALFYGAIVLIHVVGWGLLLSIAPQYPALVGLGGLAYSFGLRHAFDADHISAIDNTTRKLLQDGKRPVGVGFFFSLGHSSVVFVIALALGFAVRVIVDGVVDESGALKNIGGIIGTSVSGVFLVLIGVLNLIILLDIIGVFRRMKRGEYNRVTLEDHLVTGGVLTRLFKHLFRVITESWQMYPIGFLFGLGFDTASEGRAPGDLRRRGLSGAALRRRRRAAAHLRRGHVAHGHHRRRLHGQGLLVGILQPDSQALLQT